MAWTRDGKWVPVPEDRAPGGWAINPANYRNPFTVLPPGITTAALMRGGAPPQPNRHMPFLPKRTN